MAQDNQVVGLDGTVSHATINGQDRARWLLSVTASVHEAGTTGLKMAMAWQPCGNVNWFKAFINRTFTHHDQLRFGFRDRACSVDSSIRGCGKPLLRRRTGCQVSDVHGPPVFDGGNGRDTKSEVHKARFAGGCDLMIMARSSPMLCRLDNISCNPFPMTESTCTPLRYQNYDRRVNIMTR